MWCNGDAYRTDGQTGWPGCSSAEAETRRFHTAYHGAFFSMGIHQGPQVFGTAFCLLSLWYHFNPITVIYYITIRALTHPHMSPLMGQGIELRSPNFVLPIAILKGDHVKSHQVQNSVGRCLLGVIVATDFVDAHT